MASIYDVQHQKLIFGVAEALKKEEKMQPPEWAKFVKTGVHNERPPVQEDWWFIRSAAILRTVYKDGPIGVSKLRSKYGGRKNRGVKPEKFKRASGNIIRKIFQQLEASGFVKKAEKGKGRLITPAGQKILDQTASQLSKEKPKKSELKPKAETKKEIEKKPEPKKVVEEKKEEEKKTARSKAPLVSHQRKS